MKRTPGIKSWVIFNLERWCGDGEIMIWVLRECYEPLTLSGVPFDAWATWGRDSWYFDTLPWGALLSISSWGLTWQWAWLLSWWASPWAALTLSYDADGSLNHSWSQWRLTNAWADSLRIWSVVSPKTDVTVSSWLLSSTDADADVDHLRLIAADLTMRLDLGELLLSLSLLAMTWWHWCQLIKTFEVRWSDHCLDEEWWLDCELRDAMLELHLLTRWWLKEHWQEMRVILLHERVNALVETSSAMMYDECERLTHESIRYWHWFIVENMTWHELTWTTRDPRSGVNDRAIVASMKWPEVTRLRLRDLMPLRFSSMRVWPLRRLCDGGEVCWWAWSMTDAMSNRWVTLVEFPIELVTEELFLSTCADRAWTLHHWGWPNSADTLSPWTLLKWWNTYVLKLDAKWTSSGRQWSHDAYLTNDAEWPLIVRFDIATVLTWGNELLDLDCWRQDWICWQHDDIILNLDDASEADCSDTQWMLVSLRLRRRLQWQRAEHLTSEQMIDQMDEENWTRIWQNRRRMNRTRHMTWLLILKIMMW